MVIRLSFNYQTVVKFPYISFRSSSGKILFGEKLSAAIFYGLILFIFAKTFTYA